VVIFSFALPKTVSPYSAGFQAGVSLISFQTVDIRPLRARTGKTFMIAAPKPHKEVF
jgi:hypothetical protein